MTPYTPKPLTRWRVIAMALRALSRLLMLWPLLLVMAFLISPISPHLRWQYSYEQRGAVKYFVACEYLGNRGFIPYVQPFGQCPMMIMMDHRRIQS